MISKIAGRLKSLATDAAYIESSPFEYEVLIPEFTRRQIQGDVGRETELHTIHYIEGNPSQGGRMIPRMVGFKTEIEREFFDFFCSVDGVGVKKALRAMIKPVQEVATLIERQDAKGLSVLPGIGPATAERIIAKLRRKMPKFALLVKSFPKAVAATVELNLVDETLQLLVSLGHSEPDAQRLIDAALETKKKFKDVESLMQAVYEKNQA
ncbi:MAG: Holliday junction branch migration protein RuvA [Planctomycetota bacterium]|nr:Holliday junction branch migration protein RuvA [Planctomycetota bacterium]